MSFLPTAMEMSSSIGSKLKSVKTCIFPFVKSLVLTTTRKLQVLLKVVRIACKITGFLHLCRLNTV